MSHAQPGREARPASNAGWLKECAIGLAFRFYKSFASPVLHAVAPSRCLYLPTCSEYAYTAMSRFGILRGLWLALRRFARCHPWGEGGLDPVPDRVWPTGHSSDSTGVDHLS